MHFTRRTALLIFWCLALTACGGGGGDNVVSSAGAGSSSGSNGSMGTGAGGGGGGSGNPIAVTGKVTFDLVPVALTGSQPRLDYTAIARRPARSVTVEAIDNGTQAVLATAATNEVGDYALNIPANRSVYMRALAKMKAPGAAASAAFSVIDNTSNGAQWAISGAVFGSGLDAAIKQDLNAGSGWTGTAYNNAQRAAGPFAILDTVHEAALKIAAADPAAAFPPLDLNWSPNNIAASGNLATGQIGTSFFRSETNNGVVSRRIYVLGFANNDTDEYDRHVVAHEFGHYLQSAFSRDDSIGGQHGGANDRLDMRVAFSEGWGNAWSGIALGDPIYSDTINQEQAGGGSFNVSLNDSTNAGWFKEPSVQKVLWDLSNSPTVGFARVWATLRNGLTSNAALTSIHSFSHALAGAVPAAAQEISAILAAQGITLPTTSYAENETRFGVPPMVNIKPIYLPFLSIGGSLGGVCLDNAADTGRSGNKAGEHRYIRVTLSQSGVRSFSVAQTSSSTGSSDPDFELYGASGLLLRARGDTPSSETASASLPAGDYVMVITDYNLYAPATAGGPINANSCFNLTVQ